MLQDQYLPLSHFSEKHCIEIPQAPEKVWPLVDELDFSGSLVTRSLFFLRGIPSRMMNREGLAKGRFIRLAEDKPREVVIGLIGKFWKLDGQLQAFLPGDFFSFNQPGYAKATWNFSLRERGGATVLETETRIYCTDDTSRRRFGLYWFFVKP